MKRNNFVLASLIFLLIPTVFAAQVSYEIVNGKTLTTWKNYSGNLNIPLDAKILDNNSDKISYITSTYIEKDGKKIFFISKDPKQIGADITLTLPEGTLISQKYFIYPKEYSLTTDGRNIILKWINSTDQDVFVPYEIPTKSSWAMYGLILLIVLILGGSFYFTKKMKKDRKTLNLYRDEKRIMDYLLNKKECWTKEIVKDLGISKVRLSRKLRSLEEKGLIEKEPHGNENRIKLK
jgi:uncharacterized membrane protein